MTAIAELEDRASEAPYFADWSVWRAWILAWDRGRHDEARLLWVRATVFILENGDSMRRRS